MSSDTTTPSATPRKTPTKREAAAATEGKPEPIVVDMGKKSRKAIRKLRKGKPGKLMDRVQETLAHLRENGALAEDAQPIIIVVKERASSRGRRAAKMWGLG
jgi:hypothetical protein